jgi:hypothetical protein
MSWPTDWDEVGMKQVQPYRIKVGGGAQPDSNARVEGVRMHRAKIRPQTMSIPLIALRKRFNTPATCPAYFPT